MRARRRLRWTATAVVLFVVLSFAVSFAAHAAPYPVHINASGANGVTRTTNPGLDCPTGPGSYRHYFTDSSLPGGVVSSLAGSFRSTLDVHYNGPGGPRSPAAAQAFLEGTESHASLSNQRGTIAYSLTSGSCASKSLSFDGTTAAGSGTWSATGTGSYRQLTGSGTFTTTDELNPGANNAWTLALDGSINVLQPALTVKVQRTYWAHLGLDYVNRVVSVDYQVANSGPGDSFGDVFLGAPSGANGVRQCGEPYSAVNPCSQAAPPSVPLGDLESCTLNPDGTIPSTCDSELVTVRYFLDPLTGPCTLVLLGCTFPTTAQVKMPDALDVATTKASTQTISAPLLPPPLS